MITIHFKKRTFLACSVHVVISMSLLQLWTFFSQKPGFSQRLPEFTLRFTVERPQSTTSLTVARALWRFRWPSFIDQPRGTGASRCSGSSRCSSKHAMGRNEENHWATPGVEETLEPDGWLSVIRLMPQGI